MAGSSVEELRTFQISCLSFMFHAFRVCLCEVGFATAEDRVKSQNPSPIPPKIFLYLPAYVQPKKAAEKFFVTKFYEKWYT